MWISVEHETSISWLLFVLEGSYVSLPLRLDEIAYTVTAKPHHISIYTLLYELDVSSSLNLIDAFSLCTAKCIDKKVNGWGYSSIICNDLLTFQYNINISWSKTEKSQQKQKHTTKFMTTLLNKKYDMTGWFKEYICSQIPKIEHQTS